MMYSGSCEEPSLSAKCYSNRTLDVAHRPCHLGGICPSNIVIQPLPARDPAGSRVTNGDQALKNLRGTFLDGIVISTQLKDIFAIRAAVAHEFLKQSPSERSGRSIKGMLWRNGGALTLCGWTTEQTMQARKVRCWFGGV